MAEFNFTPLTALTADDVDKLIIHATRSSIRRAGSVKPMVMVPASENVPTLYYIRESRPTDEEEVWSIHALSADVTKFLLLKNSNA